MTPVEARELKMIAEMSNAPRSGGLKLDRKSVV